MTYNYLTMRRLSSPNRQQGFSLIELMVGVAVGLAVLTGLTLVFTASSGSRSELEKAGRQVDTGSFVLNEMTYDIRMAGYWGEVITNNYSTPPLCTSSSTCLDPSKSGCSPAFECGSTTEAIAARRKFLGCESSTGTCKIEVTPCGTSGNELGLRTNVALSLSSEKTGISHFPPPIIPIKDGLAGTECLSNKKTGSDAITVMHLDGAWTPTSKAGLVSGAAKYVHISKCWQHAGLACSADDAACSEASAPKASVKMVTSASDFPNDGRSPDCTTVLDEARKFIKSTFYINTSNQLVRVNYDTSSPEVLAEGVEDMVIEYGLADNFQAAPSTYVLASDPLLADKTAWGRIRGVRIYLLTRNTAESTGSGSGSGYKGYVLGSVNPKTVMVGDKLGRRVFSTTVELTNMAGR